MAEERNDNPQRGAQRLRLPKFLTEPINLSGGAPVAAANEETKTTMSETNPQNGEPHSDEEQVPLSSEEAQFQYLEYLVSEFQEMQSDIQRMYNLVEEVSARESAQEKVFNTLHAELREYKNDFIYEHLKPVVRPLLFLYDSLEQFDAEIALYERPSNGERRQVGLSPQLVRENISFFRDQLVESLRICEVTPMETPRGAFNPRLHKVIDVVPVEEKRDGTIQRVVRGGWYLNNQLLRSAEVIVGKKMT
jgi:molecular chaperone GrpE (heat shock protein)